VIRSPDAVLVDHPALPIPLVDGGGTGAVDGEPRRITSLGRTERERAALQLTAVTALLAELDLWPGRHALRAAWAVRSTDGLEVRLPTAPQRLARVLDWLGGGEDAVSAARRAAVDAISEVSAIPIADLRGASSEPGFFIEPEVRTLRRVVDKGGLTAADARSLWILRWLRPPFPEEGEATYWSVPSTQAARRLAAGLWCASRRTGCDAYVWPVGSDADTAPLPRGDARGLLVVYGELDEPEIAAVERWVRRTGCTASVFGHFPPGWSPPRPPVYDPERPLLHLAITGVDAGIARQVIEERTGRFDPCVTADRRALSSAIADKGVSRVDGDEDTIPTSLREIVDLLPEGLPEGFLTVHSGCSRDTLRELEAQGTLVLREGSWRRPVARRLRPDPRHRDVAARLQPDDPRRLRHEALAGGDARPLLGWARQRLDVLDSGPVRRVIADLEPGVLGVEVQLLQLEACLVDRDLAAARRCLDVIPEAIVAPWRRWLDAEDRNPDANRTPPTAEEIEACPRGAADVALILLRRSGVEGDVQGMRAAEVVIENAISRVAPLVARQIDLRRVDAKNRRWYEDKAERARLAAGHPLLTLEATWIAANALADANRPRLARRLLEWVRSRLPPGAGHRGILELDLGSAAIEDEQSDAASLHTLRAYRLLEAAGYRHRLDSVRLNLAASDIDLLRLASAEARLDACDRTGADLYVAAARVWLELARGRETVFRSGLDRLSRLVPADHPRIGETLLMMKGVAALLDGHRDMARRCLEGAGEEGDGWRNVLATLDGEPPLESGDADHWGLRVACGLLAGVPPPFNAAKVAQDSHMALGVAIASRLGGRTRIVGPMVQRAAAERLRDIGAGGWEAILRDGSASSDAALHALAVLADNPRPEALDDDQLQSLLDGLGVCGIEIRDAVRDGVMWRWGDGAPGRSRTTGRVRLIPLSGDGVDGPLWTLLGVLLDLAAPPAAVIQTGTGDMADRELAGASTAVANLRDELRALATTRVPVLLAGETGVGKEVAARVLHAMSRRSGRFVAVNMAAIPDTLLEAELFGTVRGAFTGAERGRTGLAEAADRGTLFLDEIGDLGPGLQAKLLRFLESYEVRAVGSDSSRTVDVRIVAASHRDLHQQMRAGTFRADLFFRIAAAKVRIPPLRERLDDLPALLERFQHDAQARHGLGACRWSQQAIEALSAHHWPGNARELRHVVEVAMVRAKGGVVTPADLPFQSPPTSVRASWEDAHRDLRRRLLEEALQQHAGNQSAAARSLGLSRQTFLYHLRKLGV
jgi:transcriptional regulator with AAA-type ATPase domain